MPSRAAVEAYLDALSPERRGVVAVVRDVIRRNLPEGYAEGCDYGMICWTVPLSRYPSTYNGQPLCFIGLAAQKSHFALYLMSIYQDKSQAAWLAEAFRKAGKRVDMGKSCLRFKALSDLALPAIGELVARTPVDVFVAQHEASRRDARPRATPRATASAQSKGARPAATAPANALADRGTPGKGAPLAAGPRSRS